MPPPRFRRHPAPTPRRPDAPPNRPRPAIDTPPPFPSETGALAEAGDTVRQVLVVDDSRLQRRILSALLTRSGFRVIEAETAEAALDVATNQPVDVIISDWMMPGMSGPDLCRALRRAGGDRYVYFILLTSKSETEDVAAGLDAGADDLLVKPVKGEELRARINAGERILRIERELTEKNRLVSRTLFEKQRLYEALERDLREARELQHALVPRRQVKLGAGRASFLFYPSGHVGGDLVGLFHASETRIGLFSIDVSGHGIASALISARLAGWLSGGVPEQNVALTRDPDGQVAMRRPVETAARLNAMFLKEIRTEHYFTMALADIDMTTGRVELVQAGHPHPMVQRAGGRIEFAGTGGLPLGLLDEAEFDPVIVDLDPGDRMFLHSDGLTELPTPGGGMLEEAGLARLFSDHAVLGGEHLVEALAWELSALVGDGDFPDDVSGVIFEYAPPAAPPADS